MSDRDPAAREARSTMRRLQHEMRTPLGQIIGYSEMLEEEALDRDQRDLVPDLQKIRNAARSLLELVDGLFQDPSRAAAPPAPGPVADGAEAAPSEQAPPAEATGSLLVVDDEPQNRDMLVRRLARRGYDVEVAEDGACALAAIEEGRFDLVLLDVMMPGMNGLEVLESIRRTRSLSELPVIMATALDRSEDTVAALRLGANDYVTKPFDFPVVLARVEMQLSLRRAARKIESLAQQLEFRNAFIRRTFGRFVSDEIVARLLESPEGLALQGEKRRVSILTADLRGFSSLTEAIAPVEVVSLLNNYLGTMAEVVLAHNGTIDEFLGDAILAFFGAPISREDDAERAVACAVAMQLAMGSVNERNRRQHLPEIEMGIGVATGEVVVGNIGSEKRTKYGAVGTPVILAARIESHTPGGEILICPETREAVGAAARIDLEREIHPKGFKAPLRVYRVVAIAPGQRAAPPDDSSGFVDLG